MNESALKTEPKSALGLKPSEPVAEVKALRPLEQNRMQAAHSSECGNCTIWSATLHANTPFEHTTSDGFWANKAGSMHVGDIIWVAIDDQKFHAELVVTGLRVVGPGVVPNRVSVAVLRFTEITPPEAYTDIGEHLIEFRGQHLKWCVVRRADKSIAREGCASQEDAERHRRGLSLGKTKP